MLELGWNWLFIIVPLIFIGCMAFYVRRFIRDVVDYLAAGRVAGRYLLATGDLASALGLITLVANAEAQYKTGFAVSYWQTFLGPIFMFVGLSGYCIYRYRETKALSIGQFLEMRYSKNFRIFATILRTTAELIANAIGPAIAARFFMYLFNWPKYVEVCGMTINVYMAIIIFCLIFAIFIIWSGGMIGLIVTDSMQAIIMYPIFMIIVAFIVYNFSWDEQIVPVLYDRVQGESFLNPYDIQNLRDFNLFAMIIGCVGWILNWASWYGSGGDACAKSAHEQKMASVIGTWRTGLSTLMLFLIFVSVIIFMNHQDFSKEAKHVRDSLSAQVAVELIPDKQQRKEFIAIQQAIPEQKHIIGKDTPLSNKKNLDTPYLESAQKFFIEKKGSAQGNSTFQEFRTLFNQTRLPIVMRTMLPKPILALFCFLAFSMMLTTDDSRLFASAKTLTQDIIVPFMKEHPTPKKQLWIIRLMTLFSAIVFFIGSFYFSQMDYINLYVAIVVAIWTGGAGAVMLGGLYTRWGTTAGAYAALIMGAFFSISGIITQRLWASHIYPWLVKIGQVDNVAQVLKTLSSPFEPFIVWRMDAAKFPINSWEIFGITLLVSFGSYAIVSLLTLKKPFNLDKMLHRGEYNDEGKVERREKWTLRNTFAKIIGINPEYTKGDRILAYCVFGYSFVWGAVILFCGSVLWNTFDRWGIRGWSNFYFLKTLILPLIIGTGTTVWFCWGGVRDIRRLFADLRKRKVDYDDNGSVHKEN